MLSKSESRSTPTPCSADDTKDEYEAQRRHFLRVATGVTAAVGIAAAVYPLLDSLEPSEKARVKGGPVTVDLDGIAPGEQTTVLWRGNPVWVLHRTPAEIRALSSQALLAELRDPDSSDSEQPEYAHNANRSLRPEYFVCIASCTHLGCVPLFRAGNSQHAPRDETSPGYFCPCHGSKFDLAGRVFKHVPAPKNLVVPPYHFADDDKLVIGVSAV